MKELVQKWWPYVARHWFKAGLIAVVLYAIFSKDLTVSINMRAPERVGPPGTEEQAAPTGTARRPALTEHRSRSGRPSVVTDRFGFSWSGSRSPSPELRRLSALRDRGEAEIQKFVERFARVAQTEQEKYGIPAAITLANALLFSGAGHDEAAREGHNFFMLPCTSDWQGDTGRYAGGCVRHYENAWLSFRDHSFYLTTGPHAHLKRLGSTNYAAWAQALEAAGFGQEPNLAVQLVEVIERFGLAE